MLWIILLTVIVLIAIIGIIFINQSNFGQLPRGERLERIKNSPNYRDGEFKNLSETPLITSGKNRVASTIDFLLLKNESLTPKAEIPIIKKNLRELNKAEDVLVWFGHSSYFMQVDRKCILVDPVFYDASPVSFVNKPFKGTNVYKPQDIPDIDYLIITHDHWDHLDYNTVMELKDRTHKVICPLGVGEHFEYWGFDKDKIVELDWNEESVLGDDFKVYCLPARHFSGRGLSSNQSLWASFLLKTPSQSIYIGGDSGYDTHYAEIGKRFAGIDLAILENGQYDKDWKYIHMMPEELVIAANDLGAKKVFPVHNSKYALAKHSWKTPMEDVLKDFANDSLYILTPMIGETVRLKDSTHIFNKWWEAIN